MNKKGFTLVELLAVIAILAILVIIALPNVIKLYNNAKKNTFLTEAKTIYKEAANKYITESMKGNKITYISSNTKNSLELNGSKDIEYKIRLNSDGSVRRFQVKNNSYCINGKYNDTNELIIDDVTEKECAEIDATYCKSNLSSLSTGSEVTIGKYTYKYQNHYDSGGGLNVFWGGWSVELTDKESEEEINEVPCTYIDNIPIKSMNQTFEGSKAKSINLLNINTTHVIEMSNMFRNISSIELDLSDFDTSNVESMWEMFSESKLKTIKGLEYFDTSKVTSMNNMFSYSELEQIDVSNFDTSNVTDMRRMFGNNKVIKIIGLENFNTSKVTDMIWMFSNSLIKELDLSNFDLTNANLSQIFIYARTEVVYSGDEENIEKLKASGAVPSQIKFINKNSNKYTK